MLKMLRELFPNGVYDTCSAGMKCFDCTYSSIENDKWFCEKAYEEVSNGVLGGGECLSYRVLCSDIEKCWDATVSVVAPLFGYQTGEFFSKECEAQRRRESWMITVYLMRKLSSCSFKEIANKLLITSEMAINFMVKVECDAERDLVCKERILKLKERVRDRLYDENCCP